jgi:hypothetical protein
MFIFGHLGITAASARAADRETGLALPMLFSLLPDMIDKPIFLLLPALANGSTRNVAHSLAGAAAALAVLLALGRRGRLRRPWLLWACYAGHLALDRMWLVDGPIVLLWPFLGRFPRLSPKTPHLLLYNLAGEAIGLALLLALVKTPNAFRRRTPREGDTCAAEAPDTA